MALDTDMDLYSFLDPNQAATLRETDRFTDETSEGVFHSLTKNSKKCNYCDLNQNQFLISRVNSLVLLHVNIRSLHKNFDSFHDFLIALNVSPDVICLTERYKTSRMQKCIKYQGVKIWNDIPSEIQNSNSKNFKRKMKKHLLTLQS